MEGNEHRKKSFHVDDFRKWRQNIQNQQEGNKKEEICNRINTGDSKLYSLLFPEIIASVQP